MNKFLRVVTDALFFITIMVLAINVSRDYEFPLPLILVCWGLGRTSQSREHWTRTGQWRWPYIWGGFERRD